MEISQWEPLVQVVYTNKKEKKDVKVKIQEYISDCRGQSVRLGMGKEN
jgi:hypothetical protein